MEDKMAEFIFGDPSDLATLVPKPSVVAIPGLAEAVIEVNGLFILAKLHMRMNLISVYSGGRHGLKGKVSLTYLAQVSCLLLPLQD